MAKTRKEAESTMISEEKKNTMASDKSIKQREYRIVKRKDDYLLERSNRFLFWKYWTPQLRRSEYNGKLVTVTADTPELIEEWLKAVEEGKIDPWNPEHTVVKELKGPDFGSL
jgi:hypothetical protein